MNILLIAYYYPPIIGGGSGRPQAMAKYLSRMGHRVRVLTQSSRDVDTAYPECIRIRDASHNSDRSGVRFLVWLFRRAGVEFSNRLGRYASILSPWKRETLRRVEGLLGEDPPEILIATYPPVENLEIGVFFSRKYRIPLVADFRDGLVFEPIESKKLNRFRSIHRHYQAIENEVMATAGAIVTVSPPLHNYFSNKNRGIDVFTIPNGYDEDDFSQLPLSQWDLDPARFHIVHTGSLALSDTGCDIRPFVHAIRLLLGRQDSKAKKIRIHLLGRLSRHEKRMFSGFFSSGLAVWHGVRDRKSALALQMKADLLLLATSSARTSVATTKLFEYLRSRRPILALSHRTYAAQLVEETRSGWTVDPTDTQAIADVLQRILSDPSFYSSLRPDSAKIASFERASQMVVLDRILSQVRTPARNREK